MPLNNPGGVRMSTAITYLDASRHRLNLTIRPNVLARRILFDGARATGVEAESGGEVFAIEGNEIILSAGGHPLAATAAAVGRRPRRGVAFAGHRAG